VEAGVREDVDEGLFEPLLSVGTGVSVKVGVPEEQWVGVEVGEEEAEGKEERVAKREGVGIAAVGV